ncbi:MAG: bifunctional adenosylcobinamide kinase/adenosylcobinamide-phosphate guanylyltransferase [Dethiobacter sp.]|nr:bifunctional adenosylcobinamide kinase/adenosylcobinamide-phosphate guanylyltransferase [Dethiobacter sp.]
MKKAEKGKLVLILGGARSGKSRLAEEMALASGGKTVYLATATIRDEEMAQRVEIHRKRRPSDWTTLEENCDLPGALEKISADTETVIVDCLTLWLTNKLLPSYSEDATFAELASVEKEISESLGRFCRAAKERLFKTILVANEVGCGIVPETQLGRFFRDLAGRANQLVAKEADEVFLAVAGYLLRVKGEA